MAPLGRKKISQKEEPEKIFNQFFSLCYNMKMNRVDKEKEQGPKE